MKFQKKLLMLVAALVLTLVLWACNGKTLTSIEFTGIDDVEVESGAEFNVFTGVKAMGDDGNDYTDRITVTSTSAKLNKETGDIDTSTPGEVKVRYEVRITVGDNVVLAQPWRTITVLKPPRGDELLQHGIAFWDKYENAGGTLQMFEEEDGSFRIEFTAGQETHEPRISQMGIPFEKGKTYKVSFEAKALVEKQINLQAGELLSEAPWFVEFHPGQPERPVITTDWDSYEYTFKHIIDNPRGGIIFEFGPIGGVKISTTIWLRNIDIVETEEQEDTVPPIISGADDGFVQLGSEFDPLAGVKAMDNGDGDVTDKIEVIAIMKDGVEVEAVDTSIDGAEYEITYYVEDSKGNSTEVTRKITIKDFEAEFGNVIVNGDFKLGLTGWDNWIDTGAGAAVGIDVVDEELVLDVTSFGANPWDAQVYQEGFTLENMATYQLRFTARATVARDINLALGIALSSDPWFTDYFPKQEGLELSVEDKEFKFIFRVEEPTTQLGKLVFEVGNTAAAAVGKVIISEVVLEKVLFIDDFQEEGYSIDGETVHGHVIENAGETVFATAEREANKLTVTLTGPGSDAWVPHYYYMIPRLISGTYTFKVSITASVARDLRFNVILPKDNYASLLPENAVDFSVEKDVKFEFEVEFVLTEAKDFIKIELDFGNLGEGKVSAPGTFVLEDMSLVRK